MRRRRCASWGSNAAATASDARRAGAATGSPVLASRMCRTRSGDAVEAARSLPSRDSASAVTPAHAAETPPGRRSDDGREGVEGAHADRRPGPRTPRRSRARSPRSTRRRVAPQQPAFARVSWKRSAPLPTEVTFREEGDGTRRGEGGGSDPRGNPNGRKERGARRLTTETHLDATTGRARHAPPCAHRRTRRGREPRRPHRGPRAPRVAP